MPSNPPPDSVICNSSKDREESESDQYEVVVDREALYHKNAYVAPYNDCYPREREEKYDRRLELRPAIRHLGVHSC